MMERFGKLSTRTRDGFIYSHLINLHLLISCIQVSSCPETMQQPDFLSDTCPRLICYSFQSGLARRRCHRRGYLDQRSHESDGGAMVYHVNESKTPTAHI